MKKRLKNILTKSSKKNGLLLFRCVICCTLLSGMLIGCSAIKNDSPEESVQIDLDTISQSSEDSNNSQTDGSSTDISSDTQNGTIENPPEQPWKKIVTNLYFWVKVILYARIWQIRV